MLCYLSPDSISNLREVTTKVEIQFIVNMINHQLSLSPVCSDDVEADPYYYGKGIYKSYYPGYYYGKGIYKSYYPGYYYGKGIYKSYYYGKQWEKKQGYGRKKYLYKH